MNNHGSILPYSHEIGRIHNEEPHIVTEQLKAGAKLAFIQNGEFKLVVNAEQSIDVRNGFCYMLTSDNHWQLEHRFEANSQIDFVTIDFSRQYFDTFTQLPQQTLEASYQGVTAISMPINACMQSVICQLHTCPLNSCSTPFYRQAKCFELAALLVQQLETKDNRTAFPHTKDALRAKEVAQLICQDLAKSYTSEQLAKLAGFNVRKLNNLFIGLYSCSVADFIRNKKMEKAWELLAIHKLDVTNTSAMVGYSFAHFSTLFHQHFGVPPSHVR
ncbi:AraC family transcriptional regulator [Rheinheimera sediminis]|uniref:helix-turn-helix domain-containing protein n=1 Tax=Rheinheimera sp. YQF-1 TaxID=2499626 RepID=UPI000FDA7F98|nr:AraC family transcriptional regulator [Rheinheimera sp. YQF-1]RVT41393.1 AraC family transcriptional regulator [Rheinheimera sp. YQF-1]